MSKRTSFRRHIGHNWRSHTRHLLVSTWLVTVGLASVVAHADAKGIAGNYLVGQHAAVSGDFATAASNFSSVLEDSPDFHDLRLTTISLLISDGRIDEAFKLSTPVRDQAAEAPDLALLQIVHHMRHSGDADVGTNADVETLLDTLPDAGLTGLVSPFVAAWLLAQDGDAEAGIARLAVDEGEQTALEAMRTFHLALMQHFSGKSVDDKALIALAQPHDDGVRPEIIVMAAHLLQKSGDVAGARQLLQGWLARFDDVELNHALALIDGGETLAAPVTDARSAMADALYGFALALGQDRGARQALTQARFAEYLSPESTPIKLLIGDLLSNAGNDDAANAVWSKIPEDSPHFWNARLKLAGALAASEKIEDAEAILTALADEKPDEIGPFVRLGDMFRRDEQYEKALAAYDQAVARLDNVIEPRHWGLFYTRGIAHERTKNWPEAEADFLQALELAPDHPFVLNYLGYSWVDQGMNYQRAEEMLIKAVELRPQQGFIVDSLGWVYYKLGRYDEAVEELERAVELLPNDPVINDHLGDAYWQVGRRREARFQWNRALSFDPEEEEIDKIQTKLEEGLTVPVNVDEKTTTPDETET